MRVEPTRVLGGVYFAAAYSEFRQSKATEALIDRISREGETRLVVAHRMPTFFEGATDRAKARECLNRSLSSLWRASAKRGLIMVITAVSAKPSVPIQVQATLYKHPAKETPATACISKGGEGTLGRITPPFRQNYQELVERLRRNYAGMLRGSGNREASRKCRSA